MQGLKGRVAVVTGGAQGIGRAIVEAFAREGTHVAVLDREADTGSATAAALTSAEAQVLFVEGDVSDSASVETAIEKVAAELGPPTILVNNAATFVLKGMEASPEEWHQSFDVNVMGVAIVSRSVAPHMAAAGGGAIVNIGSVSAFVPQRGTLVYNASKGAVVAMSRCMALDLADDGIRVNCVCPGTVWTPAVEQMVAGLGLTRESVGDQPSFGREQILKRLPETDEIAGGVLFLSSEDASFITGTSLSIDGGWTVR